MDREPDRIEQFKADIAKLHIADPATSRDRLALRVGLVGMVAGVALPVVAYAMSHGTESDLAQRDAIVLALIGVACAMTGGALYLKAGLSGFLRFWLVRDLHERRAQTDRMLAHLDGGDRPSQGEST